MRLGTEPRGIIASGWATSEPYYDKHWDEQKAAGGQKCLYVECEWERLLDPDVDLPLPLAVLQNGKLSEFHWTPQGSGIRIHADIAEELERVWAVHVGASSLSTVDFDDEISSFEGEERITLIRHRRREHKLRAAKLKEALEAGNGRLKCEVPRCGFDFYEVYGELGFEFAQIHHLQPLGDRSTPSVTKLNDLAIVCANCHAMIHRSGACRPLEGLIPQK